jgi:hypothetical protein
MLISFAYILYALSWPWVGASEVLTDRHGTAAPLDNAIVLCIVRVCTYGCVCIPEADFACSRVSSRQAYMEHL